MDRATQESVGLNGLPDWWTKTHGISLRPQAPAARLGANGRAGEKSWRTKEAEMSGLRVGVSSREFGTRQAGIYDRKPVPGIHQLQDRPENFASELHTRLGGITLDTSGKLPFFKPVLNALLTI